MTRDKPEGAQGAHRTIALAIGVVEWCAAGAGAAVLASAAGLLLPEFSYGAPCLAVAVPVVVLAGRLLGAADPYCVRFLALAAIEAAVLVLMWPDIHASLVARIAQPPPAEEVSLVELNVWDHNPDPARTIGWLRARNADVIVLAEARESFIEKLKTAFPDYPTFVTCEARAYCGTIILSRFAGRLLPGGWWVADGLKHATKTDPGMSLAAVELSIPDPTGRLWPVPVIATHLDRHGLSGVTDRQIAGLVDASRQAAGDATSRLILAGDFNASPWSVQMRNLGQTIDASRASAFAPTWPSGWRLALGLDAPPFLAIDHVYAGCRWAFSAVTVGPHVGSDHRPLVAHLYWPRIAGPGCAESKRPVSS